MSGYTPTTEEVRDAWWYSVQQKDNQRYKKLGKTLVTTNEANDEFDRWLAAHDAEVLAAAGVAPRPEPPGAQVSEAWLAAHDAEVAQNARAEGWDAARAEVRMIPCWFNTETGQGGFDLQHGDVASEEGAWMEVNRVLNRNPYRDQDKS